MVRVNQTMSAIEHIHRISEGLYSIATLRVQKNFQDIKIKIIKRKSKWLKPTIKLILKLETV